MTQSEQTFHIYPSPRLKLDLMDLKDYRFSLGQMCIRSPNSENIFPYKKNN